MKSTHQLSKHQHCRKMISWRVLALVDIATVVFSLFTVPIPLPSVMLPQQQCCCCHQYRSEAHRGRPIWMCPYLGEQEFQTSLDWLIRMHGNIKGFGCPQTSSQEKTCRPCHPRKVGSSWDAELEHTLMALHHIASSVWSELVDQSIPTFSDSLMAQKLPATALSLFSLF